MFLIWNWLWDVAGIIGGGTIGNSQRHTAPTARSSSAAPRGIWRTDGQSTAMFTTMNIDTGVSTIRYRNQHRRFGPLIAISGATLNLPLK